MTTNHQMTELEADLHERWLPSADQRKRAEAVLRAVCPADEVLTVHLLVNKRYGFWTKDVQVIALDGLFLDRTSALQWLNAAARVYSEHFDGSLTGGYAYHYLDGNGDEQASVFEDIACRFGED